MQIDKILPQMEEAKIILVDFHAEATSEKLAMGYMLDGKVTAVWGTHTHVPTADVQILPQGTGYITDLGMTGPSQSVIGIRPELSIEKFRGGLYSRYQAAGRRMQPLRRRVYGGHGNRPVHRRRAIYRIRTGG